MRALCFGALVASTVLGFALACGAPSSFDHLVDGPGGGGALADALPGDEGVDLVPDEALPAPRPIGPLSGTFVNGLRPRFRFELPGELTGARVELCRTPECDGDKKTFDGDSEIVPDQDLEKGFWFWRLTGKTATTIGKPSTTVWEVLVRGGGTSAIPNGSFVDIDRDGRPDLLATLSFTFGTTGMAHQVVPLLGTGTDGTAFRQTDARGQLLPGPQVSVANPSVAVADTDGDGFGDVTVGDVFTGISRVSAYLGSVDGLRDTNIALPTPTINELPLVLEAPEIDGDGYGDVIVSSHSVVLQYYGSPKGPAETSFLFQSYDDLDAGFPTNTSLTVGAGFDRDGNGLFDIAFSWPVNDGAGPVLLFPGAPRRLQEPIPLMAADAGTTPAPPTRFASGDVDGDGKTDLAFVADVAGKRSVCVFLGATRLGGSASCWTPPTPAADFGSSLASGDLEADEKDEILVGTTSGGVDVLHWAGSALTAEHLTTAFGASIAMVHPGRPGPAVWAARRPDGASLAIFKGSVQSSTIVPQADPQFPTDVATFAETLR